MCHVLQITSDITKFDRSLLESVSGITKCDRPYYKVRQILQNVTVITKWNVPDAFQTSLNKLVLEAKYITCSTVKEDLLLYYREFSAFAIVVIVQNIFKERSSSQRNTTSKRSH